MYNETNHNIYIQFKIPLFVWCVDNNNMKCIKQGSLSCSKTHFLLIANRPSITSSFHQLIPASVGNFKMSNIAVDSSSSFCRSRTRRPSLTTKRFFCLNWSPLTNFDSARLISSVQWVWFDNYQTHINSTVTLVLLISSFDWKLLYSIRTVSEVRLYIYPAKVRHNSTILRNRTLVFTWYLSRHQQYFISTC